MRRIYNPVRRVSARPEGPNPSGPVQQWYYVLMKKKLLVEKSKFDAMLSRVVQAKPVPRTSIKATGKRGPKTPILAK
jgi:hypothetical protein